MAGHVSFFDFSRHLNRDGVNLYVDALKLERQHDLPGEIRAHVSECPGCRKRVLELLEALRDVPYPAEERHPYLDREVPARRKTLFSSYAIAAGVVVLVGVSALLAYLILAPGPAAVTVIQSHGSGIDTAKAPGAAADSHDDLYAGNFTESPNLQGLVNTSYRSGETRVLSPAIGQVVRDSILFRWETDAAPPFVVRVLNNREDELIHRQITGRSFLLKMTLAPGLYYWKLEENDELLYVGKFLVKEGG